MSYLVKGGHNMLAIACYIRCWNIFYLFFIKTLGKFIYIFMVDWEKLKNKGLQQIHLDSDQKV